MVWYHFNDIAFILAGLICNTNKISKFILQSNITLYLLKLLGLL